MTDTALTKLGNMEMKLASALCYLPVMYIHLIASIAFLVMEPREHRQVRWHATQSLLVSAAWIAALVVSAMLWIFLPIVVMFGGAILAAALESDGIAALSALLGFVLQFLMLFVFLAAAFGGPLALLAGAGMVMMDKEGRIPGFAGLTDRLAG